MISGEDDDDHINPERWGQVVAWLRGGKQKPPANRALTLEEFRAEAERAFISARLETLRWNVSATALALGVSRSTLKALMSRLNIKRPTRPPRRKARARKP